MSHQLATQTADAKRPPVTSGILQRRCACGKPIVANGECAECSRKRQKLQRQATNQQTPETAPPIVHEVLREPGQPLAKGVQSFMEDRFGQTFSGIRTFTVKPQVAASSLNISPINDRFEQEANSMAESVMGPARSHNSPQSTAMSKPDFSRVRVHTGAKAADSALAVNALAYTVGHNIVFGKGQYAPQSEPGRRLLAHEMAHVVQQSDQNTPSANRFVQRQQRLSRRVSAAPARRLEFRQAIYPCACLVFIHNNEHNARNAAETLHQNCRYNLAILQAGGGRRVPIPGTGRTIDPNELFPQNIQEECTRNEAGCVAYEQSHNDLRAMQIQFFLAIKKCSRNFQLPTVALHNNALNDTRTFRRTTTPSSRQRLRGDFSQGAAQGPGSLSDLRTRLGPNRGVLTQSKTTNIFRWCNLPEISQCHIGDPDNPDHVIWVTTIQDFDRLRQQAVNVVLQQGLNAVGGTESETDLSTLLLRLGPNARYINIETPISPRNQATRDRDLSFIQQVLDMVGINCCEPVGDFPTPSRTEMYA